MLSNVNRITVRVKNVNEVLYDYKPNNFAYLSRFQLLEYCPFHIIFFYFELKFKAKTHR